MRPTPEQITRAREIASHTFESGGEYTLYRDGRVVVTDHLKAIDNLLKLWEIPEWSNDVCIAEMALDAALDRSLET